MLLRRENSDAKAILAEKRNHDLNQEPQSLPSHAAIPVHGRAEVASGIV